mmetsp:Transcript_10151/g.31167  ORF Transcript_10151/g.31167 Transcript_10151/m.31167 type:complete len:95 (+) Transcript_10151:2564-2848(+)
MCIARMPGCTPLAARHHRPDGVSLARLFGAERGQPAFPRHSPTPRHASASPSLRFPPYSPFFPSSSSRLPVAFPTFCSLLSWCLLAELLLASSF